MSTSPESSELFDELHRLRRRVRLLSVLLGGAQLFAGLVLAVCLSFLLDYFFEPAVGLRLALLIVAAVAFVWAFVQYLLMRTFARLPVESLALAVERRFPELHDSLVTAVELVRSAHPFSQGLVQQTSQRAVRTLRRLPLHRVVNPKPVLAVAAVGLTLAIAVAGFGKWQPELSEHWFRRTVLLDDIQYPRKTRLYLTDFDSEVKKVARGRDFELTVESDPGGVVPDRVRVVYRLPESDTASSANMVKVGDNRFRHTWRNVLEPVEFHVRGGDASTATYTLQTVEAPQITSVAATAQFPKHTGQAEQNLTVEGLPLKVPAGTQLNFTVQSNKPLRWIGWRTSFNDGPEAESVTRDPEHAFTWTLDRTSHLELTVEDVDGIGLAAPFPIDLIALPDQPPRIEATLEGIRQEITARATIPVQLSVKDDYGLSKLQFVHDLNSQGAKPTDLDVLQAATHEFNGKAVFQVEPLQVQVEDKLQLFVSAIDNDDLSGPKQGASTKFQFKIVSPDHLLANIATTELNLRQRFEQVVRELEGSQRELQRLPALAIENPDAQSLTRLSTERLLQEVRKSLTETTAVTHGFREVVAELRNNQVGTSAMFERLEQGVIVPLTDIETLYFPETLAQLTSVRQSAGDTALHSTVGSADEAMTRLIARCRSALEAMRKLESFNEAIAMLRGVLDAQKGLLKDTKEKQKKDFLDLLK